MTNLLEIKFPFKPPSNFTSYTFPTNIDQIISIFVSFYNLKEEKNTNSLTKIYKNITKNKIISAIEEDKPIYYTEYKQEIMIKQNFSKIINHIVKCKGQKGEDKFICSNKIIFVRNTCNGNIFGYIEDECPVINNKKEMINYLIFKGYINDRNRNSIFQQIENYSKNHIIKKNIIHSITIEKNIDEVFNFFLSIENIFIAMNMCEGHKFIKKGNIGNIGMKYVVINKIKNIKIEYTVINILKEKEYKYIKMKKETDKGPCFNEHISFYIHEICEKLTWVSVENFINSCCDNYTLSWLNKFVNYYLRKVKEFLE